MRLFLLLCVTLACRCLTSSLSYRHLISSNAWVDLPCDFDIDAFVCRGSCAVDEDIEDGGFVLSPTAFFSLATLLIGLISLALVKHQLVVRRLHKNKNNFLIIQKQEESPNSRGGVSNEILRDIRVARTGRFQRANGNLWIRSVGMNSYSRSSSVVSL